MKDVCGLNLGGKLDYLCSVLVDDCYKNSFTENIGCLYLSLYFSVQSKILGESKLERVQPRNVNL